MSLIANQEQLLISLKQVALEAGDSGRALTSLIGEISACKSLALVWQPWPDPLKSVHFHVRLMDKQRG